VSGLPDLFRHSTSTKSAHNMRGSNLLSSICGSYRQRVGFFLVSPSFSGFSVPIVLESGQVIVYIDPRPFGLPVC
jgi:hypothetical protein